MQSLLRTLAFGSTLAILAPTVRLASQVSDRAIGTWKLNVAKTKYDPGPPPKSLAVTFETAEQGIKVTIAGVDAADNSFGSQYTANYDGKDYPVTGSPTYDAVSLKRIDASTVQVTRKKGGKVVQTLRRVVSRDGKRLTVTSKGKDAKGHRFSEVDVLEKQ